MTLWNLYEKSEVFRQAEGGEVSMEVASLFVSGILLREILCPDIKLDPVYGEYSLEEIWYVICLYHDKRVEQQHVWEKVCMKKSNEDVMRRLESQNRNTYMAWGPMPLCFEPLYQYIEEGVCFSNGTQITKCRFAETEVNDYFHFRNVCCKRKGMDHGIVGGLLLYDNLMQRYINQKGEPDKMTLNLYSYVANTMMVHNIWETYSGKYIISPENDPLLFFLVLAEVMEPLQYRRNERNYKMLLNAIRVEIFERQISLQLDPDYFFLSLLESRCKKIAEKVSVRCDWECATSKIRISM